MQGNHDNFCQNNKKSSLIYDELSKTLFVSNFDAETFSGDVINFKGADLANAHLVNTTIDGYIPHLAVNTLEIQSESARIADGSRIAIFDTRGGLSSADGIRWDKRKESLHVQSLSSYSNEGIQLHSNIDLNFNKIRNFHLDDNTTLKQVRIEASVISNTKLMNTTFDDVTLGSVKVDNLAIKTCNSPGSFLTVGDDGYIADSKTFHEFDDSISITKKVDFMDSVDFKNSRMENVKIESGELSGSDELDLDVRNIKTKTLTLSNFADSKTHIKDTLVIVREDGSLTSSKIELENGWIGDMKVDGSIDFIGNRVYPDNVLRRKRGKIIGANIQGGKALELEELSVLGEALLGNSLRVNGDTYIDGGLTVSGSVLGSGPYVDVSDRRLKKNVQRISCEGILEKLSKLQAVQYNLHKENNDGHTITRATDTSDGTRLNKSQRKEIGFIAQEVQEFFPDLVSKRPDGFLGLQYSRFVPLIVEGLKDMKIQLEEIQKQNQALKEVIERLQNN